MPSRADNALQTKLIQLLKADTSGGSSLQGLLGGAGRIWDFGAVPDSLACPYLELGEIVLSDFGSHETSGFEGDITIHVWTQSGRGRKDAHTILNRVYELLHNQDLSLTGFPTISFRCELNEVLKDPDNRTYHGVQRYRVILGGN